MVTVWKLMFKKLLFTGIALILPLMSSAQKTVTASGSYTYYAPMNIPPDQAEMTAIERAKISIIENEWGTVMGVRNFTEVENHNGKSSVIGTVFGIPYTVADDENTILLQLCSLITLQRLRVPVILL